MIPNDTNEAHEQLRDAIRNAQLRGRPRGMPPAEGLLYQPVPFAGFEDLGCERNSSEHRLEMIVDWLGDAPPSRVLDLGCANGYFLFRLQQLGRVERGLGVDHFAGNVETCRLLAEHHGLRELEFRQGTVSPDLVDEITAAERFDLALWMSVHHHIVRDAGIEAAKKILRLLYERAGVVVVEQGSLTDEEYQAWTSREEPFSTRAFTRLLSLAEACDIPREHAFCIGMGRYLSGERDDMQGAGRTILGFSREGRFPRRILRETRKAHKNGIYMEILELENVEGEVGEVWKNVVRGDRHHARQEAEALTALSQHPGFVRCSSTDEWEIAGGFLRLEPHALRPATAEDAKEHRLREQAIERLQSLAACGLIHGELHAEHLLLDHDSGVLICLDLETARFPKESAEAWWERVGKDNPALGLGSYSREEAREQPDELDLLALNSVFQHWNVAPLTEEEGRVYRSLLTKGRAEAASH